MLKSVGHPFMNAGIETMKGRSQPKARVKVNSTQSLDSMDHVLLQDTKLFKGMKQCVGRSKHLLGLGMKEKQKL